MADGKCFQQALGAGAQDETANQGKAGQAGQLQLGASRCEGCRGDGRDHRQQQPAGNIVEGGGGNGEHAEFMPDQAIAGENAPQYGHRGDRHRHAAE